MIKTTKSHSDKLYYGKYKYALSLKLGGIFFLHLKSHEIIDTKSKNSTKFQKSNSPISEIEQSVIEAFTIENYDSLHRVLDVIQQFHDERIVIKGWSDADFYFNDLSLIENIKNIDNVEIYNFRERIVDRPPNTIKLKKSSYKFRSYFSNKTRIYSDSEKNIKEFLLAQPTEVLKPSPTMNRWLHLDSPENLFKRRYPLIRGIRYYPQPLSINERMFIDYNDTSILSVLNLMQSGIIRKTLDIIVDK